MTGSSQGLSLTSGVNARHQAQRFTVQLRTTSPWRAGYDRTDVDRVVATLTRELDRLQEANAVARREIDRLRNYFRDRGIEVGCGGVHCRTGAAGDDLAAAAASGSRDTDEKVEEQTFIGRAAWPTTHPASVDRSAGPPV